MLKTFAQLKRDLQVGVKVKTLVNNCKPEMEGQVRPVGKVQTNAIAFVRDDEKLSWLWWPDTAKNIEYDNNIFSVYEKPNKYNNQQRTLLFTYEILN